MSRFFVTLEASAVFSLQTPTIEVLVDGIPVSSQAVTAHSGVSTNIFNFSFYTSGNYPSSLSFRFNDGLGEGGRSIVIESVRINGQMIDKAVYVSLLTLLNGGAAGAVNTAALDHLFGLVEPTPGDYGPPNITGTSGNDTIVGGSGGVIISAGDGNDIVSGGDGDDVIFGGGGADIIFGRAGNDIIIGGDGYDIIFGGSGNDLLYGSADNDVLIGDDGNDVLNGGAGNDALLGDSGDDILFGGDGDDLLFDTDGTNYLYGQNGNDTVIGGINTDYMYGGDGDDFMDGGAGDDFIFGENGADFIMGGAGNDTIDGGAGNDLIFGDAGNDTIDGGADDDAIYGDAGNDILSGGTGNDTLIGGAGADTLNGGDGNDSLYGHSLTNLQISTVLYNNPNVYFSEYTNSFYKLVSAATVDFNTALASAATMTLAGYAGVTGHLVTITSALENSFVYTVANGNVVWIGASDYAAEGEWRWLGGTEDGSRFSTGSVAANNYYTNWAAGEPNNGGGASNYAVLETTGQWYDRLGTETHYFVVEWDGISFSDDNAADTLNGDAGADYLVGGGGADIINGGDGNDQIFGGAGNDILNGGNDNDYIVDYEGSNTFNGGAGDDTLDARYLPSLKFQSIQTQIDNILAANPGVDYNADTGNFYKYISATATWSTANTNAATQLINGVAAHLVTITSADENDYIDALSGAANIYIGGTDSGVEGVWRWSGGPENNQQFWQGTSSGSAQNGFYTNFASGQPSATNTDKDYLGMNDGGLWTDERLATTRAYVIEWEGSALLIDPPPEPAQSSMTMNGGTGNDTIYGGNAADIINGDDGNDVVYGGAGNDTLHGNNNDDTIYGQDGNDLIYGDSGNDFLDGGDGADTLYGDVGNDTLYGGADNDTLYGDAGNDILAGNGGSDTLYGGDNDDTLYAGTVNTIILSANFNTGTDSFTYADGVYGSSGSSNNYANGTRITTDGNYATGALEVVLGASGVATTNISGAWSIAFNLASDTSDLALTFDYRMIRSNTYENTEDTFIYASIDGTKYGRGGNNYVAWFESSSGTGTTDTGWVRVTLNVGSLAAGAHTLSLGGLNQGSNVADEVSTMRFDDVRLGIFPTEDKTSTNTLYGGNGNDTLYGTAGTDTLVGGAGNDILYSGSSAAVTVSDILAANPGVVYNATTGSFYKYVSGAVSWSSANTTAQASLINGIAGHLAVVTNATENAYMDSITGTAKFWLGGTDSATEGNWKWVGGPDNGNTFWIGTASGSAQNGYYTNWAAGEPNADRNSTDYLAMSDGGKWSDERSSRSYGYVIEWEDTNILSNDNPSYLNGGDGLDHLYGNEGIDVFIFEAASAFNNVDFIYDFRTAQGDKINLNNILSGYDSVTKCIADYVMFSDGTQGDSYAATIRNYDPLLYYRLGETSGTTANDSMGVLSGSYVNTPLLNQPDFRGTLTDNAVDLNGSSQYVRVADSAVFDLNAATFMAWFRSDTASGTQIVMSKDGTTGGQFNIGANMANGHLVGMLQNGTGAATNIDVTLGTPIAINTWYHLAFTFSTTSGVNIYLNGSNVYTNAGFTTALASNYDFIIGASNVAGNTTMAQYFNGRIDDVTVFGTKMTANTVANVYNAGLNAVDGTFADGIYVSTGGTANYHNAATKIADFVGPTLIDNAMDMLANGNLVV